MMDKFKTLKRRIADAIERHRMVDDGESILVGVSGGADSVCLIRILHELGYPLGIAHLNHGLRGKDSNADEEFVGNLAEHLGIPFFRAGVDLDTERGNLEAEAREARRLFLERTADRGGFSRIALGHSRDDRAETFLLHLMRGAGPEGLSSMRPVAGRVIRPLIEIPRSEIVTYLEGQHQPWRHDESNDDLGFARNRMRHVVLPTLAAEFNRRLPETLNRTADLLEAENQWIERVTDDWLADHGSWEGTEFLIDIGHLPDELGFVRRILRAALETAGGDVWTLEDVGFRHMESVRSLIEVGKSGRVIELPGGIRVERNFEKLVFGQAGSEPVDYEYELPIPGRVVIPEIGMTIDARILTPDDVQPNQNGALVDGESLGPCVKIRNWRNGDFYNPVGLPASKLKRLFQKGRIPRRQRHQWPVLVAPSSSIVWVASFPVSRDFVPTGRSHRIIALEAVPAPG